MNHHNLPLHNSCENPGSSNLEVMEYAQNYTNYIGRLVSSNLPSDGFIIDFGAGDGRQTQKICRPSNRIICIESDSRRVADLMTMGYEVRSSLDDLDGKIACCIYSINCIEHIKNDEESVRQFNQVLTQGGILLLFVPALPSLYSKMDETVGHYRRYTKRGLQDLLTSNGFKIDVIRYVDSLGVIASFLFKARSSSSGTPSRRSILVYDQILFPVSRVIDVVLRNVIGKNLFVVAQKT